MTNYYNFKLIMSQKVNLSQVKAKNFNNINNVTYPLKVIDNLFITIYSLNLGNN